MCASWASSYFTFLEDMGPRPEGMTLERVDNTKGYSKDNCEWATAETQARNRSSNVNLTVDGVTKTVREWSLDTGINDQTLYHRVRNGWTHDRIVKTPLKRKFTGNQWTERNGN
jgi:hypothetical protein